MCKYSKTMQLLEKFPVTKETKQFMNEADCYLNTLTKDSFEMFNFSIDFEQPA